MTGDQAVRLLRQLDLEAEADWPNEPFVYAKVAVSAEAAVKAIADEIGASSTPAETAKSFVARLGRRSVPGTPAALQGRPVEAAGRIG